MRGSKIGLAWCFLPFIGSLAGGESISWIDGTFGPAGWSVTPPAPSSGDVISFSGPTNVYGNACAGEMDLGGTPQLWIDHVSQVIEVRFQPPAPDACALIFQPVSGLQGDFGPLAPGNWLFRSTVGPIAFSMYFTVSGAPAPSVIYVDDNAPGPVHNGSSWAWAYRYLQDALNVASAGDEIRVAQGVYRPDQGASVAPGDRSASFVLKDGVVMWGGYVGWPGPNPNNRHPVLYETLLTGDLQGDDLWGILNRSDNSYHVVRANGLVLPTTEVDGFTIADGHATAAHPHQYGAGILIQNAAVKFKNCNIHHCVAGFGGAVANLAGSPSFVNCQINGNRSQVYGGGLYAYEGSINLTNCLITGNASNQADTAGGSAIHSLGGSLDLECCTVADNVAPQGKAIVSLSWGFPPTIHLQVDNSILYNGAPEILTNHGGAVTVQYSDVWGGWVGPGNIDADPMFVQPGFWTIEGEWIVGDYTLPLHSPCVDSGSNGLLPADDCDIDEDGNIAETLPIDLNGDPRIQGGRVDMGCYERAAVIPPPPPTPAWLPIKVIPIEWDVPNGAPPLATVSASGISLDIELNFIAELKLEIQPASPAGGTWTAWFDPDPGPVGPGNVTVNLGLQGVNIDTSQLTPGPDRKVAELTILARPI
ncbi:MAG: right-handed parallel beta-helix repeat-containing protein [Planctomycetes bacterium]|nr:right-handed parallel beta-helix repeat-containing protein [Planctomycetota bacterium]